MSDKKKNIHLLCNAHLDPVWLWEWEEGAAEAISTFRTAAELCEKNNAFIFNHNEVTLYKWVQEYEPSLFSKIQKLVKQGKWNIMGGWYLQPDCNMPSGESFIRQILLGKTYFKKHFGVDVTTAINFDPFGHTRGLVQILAKSGYDSYLFGRPAQHDCPLPADEFTWVGYDGSEVMATRFSGWYNSNLGHAAEKIERWLKDFPDKKVGLILWGVGNHGGGPSRKDLRDVNRLLSQEKEYCIIHSTPQAYFKELKKIKDQLPRHDKDINPWAIGCYTSQVRIKQKQRLLENEIYMLEKMASTASAAGLMEYPQQDIQQALEDLMVGQFHDILPGSSIQPVEEASIRMLDHGLEIISRLKARAFFALSSGQKLAKENTIPVMVYNPHPYKVRRLVECEFNLPDFCEVGIWNNIDVWQNGKLLPSQVEKELSNLPIDWRKRVAFVADLLPGQMNRFDCTFEIVKSKPAAKLKIRNGKINFKTKDLNVVVNSRTGLIDRYRVKGVDIITGRAGQLLVIKDDSDPWGMLSNDRNKVEGSFKLLSKKDSARFAGIHSGILDPVRVIEDGPARSIVEVLFGYGDSFVCQLYKLPKIGTEVEIETRVYWNEKDKMLKLSIPVSGDNNKYLGQVACGHGELPTDGTEAVAQKWVAVTNQKKNLALTCINDGIYGSEYTSRGLRVTLLRSPAYSCHPWEDRLIMEEDRYIPRIDQGERLFNLWINGGRISERINSVDREALVHNEKPFALSFFPPGQGKKIKPLAILSDKYCQIIAMKKAQDNNDIIIRLFEPTGRKRSTELSMPALRKKIKLEMDGFEIKTIRINAKSGTIRVTDLLEKPIKKR